MTVCMERLATLVDHINRTRTYTHRVLEQTDRGRWFEMPGGGTHIAWQVGHLAVSEGSLLWERLLGRELPALPGLTAGFGKLFGKGSMPLADATLYPSADAIVAALDAVHVAVMAEVAGLRPATLDDPPGQPHWAMTNREDAIWWFIRHESLHTGQIGLCRRLMGAPPWR